jgi:hypothetical protein
MSKLHTTNIFYDNVPLQLRYRGCSSKGIYIDICVPSNALRQLSKYRKYLVSLRIREAKGVSQLGRVTTYRYITIRALRTS